LRLLLLCSPAASVAGQRLLRRRLDRGGCKMRPPAAYAAGQRRGLPGGGARGFRPAGRENRRGI